MDLADLRSQLRAFQRDETHHLAYADGRAPGWPRNDSASMALWSWIVHRESRAAVSAAKQI